MAAPIVINRITVKGGIGTPGSEYAQLLYKGEEIGFIIDQGIFLKIYDPKLPTGVFQNIGLFSDKTFGQKCQMVEKHWAAIYDNFTMVVRGK